MTTLSFRTASRGPVLYSFHSVYEQAKNPPADEDCFENGYIVLISPDDYFGTPNINRVLKEKGLVLGKNALVFYETRAQWDANNPKKLKWKPAQSRIKPLKGNFVARVPATTAAAGGARITEGFCTTSNKGSVHLL